MAGQPVSKTALLLLLAGAVVLPIGTSVVLGLAVLLGSLGDPAGATALRWVALGLGVVWVVNLVLLVLVQAFHSLSDSDDPGDSSS
jgi:hypothetical protein